MPHQLKLACENQHHVRRLQVVILRGFASNLILRPDTRAELGLTDTPAA